MGQAWREVARRVDRVAGRAAERQADPEHQHADQERLKPPAEDEGQIDVTRRVERLSVRRDGENPEQQPRCRSPHRGSSRLDYESPDRWQTPRASHRRRGRGPCGRYITHTRIAPRNPTSICARCSQALGPAKLPIAARPMVTAGFNGRR